MQASMLGYVANPVANIFALSMHYTMKINITICVTQPIPREGRALEKEPNGSDDCTTMAIVV